MITRTHLFLWYAAFTITLSVGLSVQWFAPSAAVFGPAREIAWLFTGLWAFLALVVLWTPVGMAVRLMNRSRFR